MENSLRECLRLPEGVARPMAAILAPDMARRFDDLSISKRELRFSRNVAVREAFTGRNHAEVTRRFNISRRTLYRILAERTPASGERK